MAISNDDLLRKIESLERKMSDMEDLRNKVDKLERQQKLRDDVLAALASAQSFTQTIDVIENMASRTIGNVSKDPTFYVLDPTSGGDKCYYHNKDAEGRNSVSYADMTNVMKEVVDGKKIKVNGNTAYIPIMSATRPIGVLAVESDTGIFKKKEIETFKFDSWFINAIQPNIDRELAHQNSIKDPLTQMYNVRGVEERVGKTWVNNSPENAEKKTAAVIMFDIDHFKNVNDTYGHAAGDIVIKSVADRIRNKMRETSDCAGRVGGEEMLGICTGNITPAQGVRKAYQIHDDISNMTVTVPDKDRPGKTVDINVTVSAGVKHVDITNITDHSEALALLKRSKGDADRNLYSAKEASRNTVCADKDAMNDYIADEAARLKYSPNDPAYAQMKAKTLSLLSEDNGFDNVRDFVAREINSSDDKQRLLSVIGEQSKIEEYKNRQSVKIPEKQVREQLLVEAANDRDKDIKQPGE